MAHSTVTPCPRGARAMLGVFVLLLGQLGLPTRADERSDEPEPETGTGTGTGTGTSAPARDAPTPEPEPEPGTETKAPPPDAPTPDPGALAPALLPLDAPPAAEPERAPPEGCTGQPVAEVTLDGCDVPFCEVPEQAQRFVTLSDIEAGQVLDTAQLTLARGRLLATGFFREVEIRCAPGAAGVTVTLAVETNTFVRNVSISGNRHFRETDIRKRVFLRSGSVLNVVAGREREEPGVLRQITSLQRLYQREGIEDVAIEIKAEQVGKAAVDITIEIGEGERDRIRELEVRHIEELPPRPGEQGCPQVPEDKLEELVGIKVGDLITSRAPKEIKTRLREWFHSVGFVNPEVHVDIDGTPLKLTVEVSTERCWLIRLWQREAGESAANAAEPSFRFTDPIGRDGASRVGDAPYERVNLADWRETLPFGASGVFDVQEAALGVDALRGALQSQGYLFADVAMEHRALTRRDRGSGLPSPVDGIIDYLLTLNYERRIQGIRLPGVTLFDEEEVREVMGTRVYDFLEAGGELQVDRVLHDLGEIERFYRERGFHRFRFGLRGDARDRAGPRPRRTRFEDGEWIVWEYLASDRGFRVRKRRDELVVYLEIPIEEGPRTQVGEVTVLGCQELPEAEARSLLGLERGTPYEHRDLEVGLKRIRRRYGARGFHRVQVDVTCDGQDPPPPDGVCLPERAPSGRLDLFVRITEGPRTVIGETFWRGNFKTQDSILTQDLPEEGTPYDPEAIAEAARRLRNQGVFNAVKIDVVGLDAQAPRDRVALVIAVEEAKTQFLDLALGFRTIDRVSDARAPAWVGAIIGQSLAASDRANSGFSRAMSLALPDVLLVGEAQYVNRNFLGYAHELRLPLQYGASTTDPVRLVTFEPTYTIPRIVTLDARLEVRLFGRLDRVTEIRDFAEFGLETSLTWLLQQQMSVTLSGGASGIRFENPDSANPIADEPFHPQGRVSLRWRWDQEDSPLHPTRGFALWGSFGYIFELSEQYRSGAITVGGINNFLKWEVAGEVAFEIPPFGWIAAIMAHYGQALVLGSGEVLLPLNERFTLGGSNGMRGFADNAVGSYDEGGHLIRTSEVGNNLVVNGSIELRIPLIPKADIWAVAFVDWGLLAAGWSRVYAASVRTSAGFGLRYLIGGQIPIRLDFGFIVPGPRVQAPCDYGQTCGKEEPWQVHFGFLYPF